MAESKLKSAKRAGGAWLDLEKICRKIHLRLYEKRDKALAGRYRPQLEQILKKLPSNDPAILREEGLALLHELQGDVVQAIKHRKREIQLIERLHKSVEQSVRNGDYDMTMANSILANRRTAALNERREILAALEQQRASTDADVVSFPRSRGRTARRTG